MEKSIGKSLLLGLASGVVGGGTTTVAASLGLASLDAILPVFATCAVMGTLIHNAKQAITGIIDNRAHTLRSHSERILRHIGDLHGIARLVPYSKELPLPFGGGWALTGDSAAILVREALVREPATVLELGSGVSTLLLGQIMKKAGRGRLLSVDHDPVWASQTRRYVEFLGLQDVVSVVDAPLKNLTLKGQTVEWYDIPRRSLVNLGPIDLLIVDGPPQLKDNALEARYPALPLLREHLSPHAAIFVDDASRDSELRMLERWKADDPEWDFQWFNTVDGVCLLTRRSGVGAS